MNNQEEPVTREFKAGEKVTHSDYPDRLFRVYGYFGKMSNNNLILEDWHDKTTQKKKGHQTIQVPRTDEYKVKLI